MDKKNKQNNESNVLKGFLPRREIMDFSNPKTAIFKSIITSKFGESSFCQIEKHVKLQEGQTLDSIFANNLECRLDGIISEKYGYDKASEISSEMRQRFINLKDDVMFVINPIQILDLLGDIHCRMILDSIITPIEESEIVRVAKIAKTTVHRKIKDLLESGLIKEKTKVMKRNGKYVIKYKKSFHTINIRYASIENIEIAQKIK